MMFQGWARHRGFENAPWAEKKQRARFLQSSGSPPSTCWPVSLDSTFLQLSELQIRPLNTEQDNNGIDLMALLGAGQVT